MKFYECKSLTGRIFIVNNKDVQANNPELWHLIME